MHHRLNKTLCVGLIVVALLVAGCGVPRAGHVNRTDKRLSNGEASTHLAEARAAAQRRRMGHLSGHWARWVGLRTTTEWRLHHPGNA